MNTIREVLSSIKKIRGQHTDAELAGDMGISINTMRSWVRNESLTRQLIGYCADHNISLDEVLLDKRVFNRERCEVCAMRLQCDEYRRATSKSLVVQEDMFSPRTIVLNTYVTDKVTWHMFQQDVLKSQCTFDLEQIDRIIVELHHTFRG
jgi:hypothetical protein